MFRLFRVLRYPRETIIVMLTLGAIMACFGGTMGTVAFFSDHDVKGLLISVGAIAGALILLWLAKRLDRGPAPPP